MEKILLIITLTCMLLLVSCSDKHSEQPPEPPVTTPPPETVPVTAEETEIGVFPDAPPVMQGPEEPRFVSNEGKLTLNSFQPDAEQWQIMTVDKERSVIVMYNRLRDKDFNLILTDGQPTLTDIRVLIYDRAAGKAGEAVTLSGNAVPGRISYTADGCVLLGTDFASGRTIAWKLSADGTKASVTPTEYDGYMRTQYITSPDGKYTVYGITDESVSGGIILESGGDEVMILKNAIYDIDVDDIRNVRGYHPVGFLDNERLVYNITGWEWAIGYGIYNVKTGENRRYETGHHAAGIYDGTIYTTSTDYDGLRNIYAVDKDHVEIDLVKASPLSADITALLKRPQFMYQFSGGRWLIAPYTEDGIRLNTVYIYSADLTKLEAEIYYEIATGHWTLSGDTVTAVITG